VALAIVLLGSFALRARGLESRGMGHAESYTPNIELPTDYGEPRARLTLPRTITNSMWEPHPPGYYIGMWFYTKVVGTGLIAIRTPSVIFGVLAVLLTFVLGRMESDSITALLGAALVGFGGHQILWSQIARPATMLVSLGLLSSILLLRMHRRGSRRDAWMYAGLTVVGVSLEHYYWILFAGQLAFSLMRYLGEPARVRRVIDYQLIGLIGAAPFLALAASQTSGAAYIGADVGRPIQNMMGLGFLFEHDIGRDLELVDTLNIYLAVAGAVLILLGLVGFTESKPDEPRAGTPLPAPPMWLVALLTVGSTGAALAASYLIARFKNAPLGVLSLSAVVPPLSLGVAFVMTRFAPQLEALIVRLPEGARRWFGGVSITAVMLIAPLTLAAAVSMIKPVLVSRHLMSFVPFLLLLTARGVVRIGSFRPRWLSIAMASVVVAGLVGVYTIGYAYQSVALPGPHDYRGLAKVWVPAVQPTDVILVRNQFRSTPIFYYMPPSRFNFIGLDHVNEVRRRSPPRIWVMVMDGVLEEPEIAKALAGYHLVSTVSAFHIRADLYEPNVR